jgi:hypothetical protein
MIGRYIYITWATTWVSHEEGQRNGLDRPSSDKTFFVRQASPPAVWKEVNPEGIKRKPAPKIK